MITNETVPRREFSLLELAKELDNVGRACKVRGYAGQRSTRSDETFSPTARKVCWTVFLDRTVRTPIQWRPRWRKLFWATP